MNLQEHIQKCVRKGYIIQAQTETSAQLVKPKVFSAGWALFWFLMFGIGLVVYLFYYAVKSSGAVYLYVEDAGLPTEHVVAK